MPVKPQYLKASDMTVLERLKKVSTFVARGFSDRKIAEMLDCDPKTVRADRMAVVNRNTEIADLDEHLRNVTERTKEQLQQIGERKALIWQNIDYSNEMVKKFAPDGSALIDPETSEYVYGPRAQHMVATFMGQLSAIHKEEQQILGLLDKSVDVTVKLEQNMRIQIAIMEVIQGVNDPQLYSDIRRRIAAIAQTPGGEKIALPSPIEHDDVS